MVPFVIPLPRFKYPPEDEEGNDVQVIEAIVKLVPSFMCIPFFSLLVSR